MKALFTCGLTGAGALLSAMRSNWVVRRWISRKRLPGWTVFMTSCMALRSSLATVVLSMALANGVRAGS